MTFLSYDKCMDYENEPPKNDEKLNKTAQKSYLELNKILRSNDLYDDLHQILHNNRINLTELQKENDIDSFCDKYAISLNMIQKLKFRKLIRIMRSNKYTMKSISDTDVICNKMNVVLIGDSGVGKTSLMNRYINNTFHGNSGVTIGVDCMCKQQILSDESVMTLNIWDTAGQEKYESVSTGYYRKGDCIIICYDVSKKQSFDNCKKGTK
eukprot:UN13250